MLLRAEFLIDAQGINMIQGRGFHVDELVAAIGSLMEGADS